MNYKLDKVLLRPDRVFRFAGLLTCVITAVSTVFAHWYGSSGLDALGLLDAFRRHFNLPFPSYSMVLVDLVAFSLFGWSFWRNLEGERLLNPDRMSLLLLALQSLLGLLVATPLFFLVAAEVCFILTSRMALLWVLMQMVAGIALAVALPDEALPGYAPGANVPPRVVALLVQCLMYPMILSFCYCLGLLCATEWRGRRELARVNAELKAMQALQADSVRLAERLYISRELHDALGHHLAALSINLQLATHLTTGEAATPVREAHLIARTLLSDVRDVVSSLRHESSVDLRRALEMLSTGVKHPMIHLSMPDELTNTDPLQAHTMFRCAQEIITNAMRHAGARNLWLEVSRDEQGLLLRARDDGRGAERLEPGNGLRGMRERVEEHGGELHLESKAGDGLTAKVWLPFATGGV